MACGCKKGAAALPPSEPVKVMRSEGGKSPADQCLYCAGKHLAEAWGCYYEYGYRRDDLRQIQASLRLIVLHTFKAWPALAKAAREAAVILQRGDFTAFEQSLKTLCDLYDGIFAEVEPDVQKRLDDAAAVCDIIIPLGNGSVHQNDELRYLLRSIERNAIGVGRVIVVSDCAPEWLSDEVIVCKCGDPIGDNKDANLITKTIKAIEQLNIENMTWCADDNIFVKPIRLSRIPTIYNRRVKADFLNGGGRWRERVLSTFAWAESKGITLEHCLESHAPQSFLHCGGLPALVKAEDVIAKPVTIMTFFHVLMNTWRGNSAGLVKQDDIKATYEGIGDFTEPDQTFAGYNDAGLANGLLGWMQKQFNTKSKYER